MLQRLPIALEQVKVGNTSGNLINEIRQIIDSLYREEEVTKKLYNDIMNSIRLENRVGTNLWILRIVKHLIPTDYYSIFRVKKT